MTLQRSTCAAVAVLLWLTCLGSVAVVAAEPSKPFYLAWEAPKEAFADAAFLLDAPAGKHGPIAAREGHFAFADGPRVKFWGANLSGAACFPPKDVAERVADRLAKYGFNLVRFHHMDSGVKDRIFDPRFDDTRHFDKDQMDRLDYLIALLEKRGIYVNLNLHVGRRFRPADGVAQADWLSYGKYCTIFDPRMIELQKEYARNLLTHLNTYTGKTYADDPAVIIVELTNENSLLGGWTGGRLRGEQRSRPDGGGWADIPPFYGEELTRFFNQWLLKRYKTRAALVKAWGEGARRAGPPILVNGDFAKGADAWTLSVQKGAQAKMEVVSDSGQRSARIDMASVTDTRWHVMLTQQPLKIRQGEKYAVGFRLKASSARQVAAEVCHAGPYRGYGNRAFDATIDWTDRVFTFVAPADDNEVRLSFQLGAATGTVWISDVRMMQAGIDGLRDDEDLAKGTVRRLTPEQFGSVTPARFRDEGRFYYETELAYYREMERLLKNELRVKALIEGTNHNYGLPCLWAESALDLMDCHAYWQHPRFPRRPWSRTDWDIGNSAMLDEPPQSTIARLCRSSVAGKPFTVSEYNHPYPNEYGCEMPLLIAAYGALQDWDAIYPYTFCHQWSERELSGNVVTGYFDVCNEVPKMAQMPSAALLFRRGDVQPAKRLVTVAYDEQWLFDSLGQPGRGSSFGLDGDLSPLLPLVHRFRVGSFNAERTTRVEDLGFQEPKGRIASDTGELVWVAAGKQQNHFTIDTPRLAAAVGWIGGKRIELAGARFEIETPAFCAVSAVSLDGKPLRSSDRVLVVAAARCANTGMKWNDQRNSITDQWGGPPILIEPVEGRLTVHRANDAPPLAASALDGRGLTLGQGKPLENGTLLPLRSEPATVWYALTR